MFSAKIDLGNVLVILALIIAGMGGYFTMTNHLEMERKEWERIDRVQEAQGEEIKLIHERQMVNERVILDHDQAIKDLRGRR